MIIWHQAAFPIWRFIWDSWEIQPHTESRNQLFSSTLWYHNSVSYSEGRVKNVFHRDLNESAARVKVIIHLQPRCQGCLKQKQKAVPQVFKTLFSHFKLSHATCTEFICISTGHQGTRATERKVLTTLSQQHPFSNHDQFYLKCPCLNKKRNRIWLY